MVKKKIFFTSAPLLRYQKDTPVFNQIQLSFKSVHVSRGQGGTTRPSSSPAAWDQVWFCYPVLGLVRRSAPSSLNQIAGRWVQSAKDNCGELTPYVCCLKCNLSSKPQVLFMRVGVYCFVLVPGSRRKVYLESGESKRWSLVR